ncbi:amidohydrolase family protein [Arthrobacter sp. STN4]|uniref:amidohydrolase n=1 Tax=Arthrobacter sp. STN4 TaxID=2923276 RepID=UPI002119EA39|nr:amidohydrolase family protein [Arthrobacter sp. STN4]MCQ9162826.1 amidohydrolase family protein [Arthrobacter sp. STN4]
MSTPWESPSQTPDLVLFGGTVLTGELPAGPDRAAQVHGASALAITGGVVTAVGGDGLRHLAGPATRLVDLRGGTVLPGINDAHLHLVGTAMTLFGHVKIGAAAAANWDQVVSILGNSPVPPDGWIRAHGWDSATLGPGGAQALAQCRQDVPVVAFDQTGHQLLANAAALRRAGITDATHDPDGGVIERHADGSPTGLLQDGAAVLMNSVLPDVPGTVLHSALLKTQALLHARGITSLTEPGLGPGSPGLFDGSGTTGALELLGDMAAADELSLRVAVLMLFAGTGGVSAAAVRRGLSSGLAGTYLSRGIDPRRLAVAGVKVFSDGIPRSNTAWMHEPYGAKCTHGHLVVAGDTDEERVAELGRILALIDDAGLQAGIHATGDAATETAVELLSGLAPGRGPERRHYIIHGAFSGNETLHTMARRGIGYSTNPLIRATAGDLMRGVMGEERFARHQPLRSALSAGAAVNLASDSPVTSTDWRRTIIAAVRRATPSRAGAANDPERITSLEALAAMTSLPAWQDHAETYKGTLRPGMVADLCVLDGPWPDENRIEELMERQVVLTAVGGQIVHDLSGWPA